MAKFIHTECNSDNGIDANAYPYRARRSTNRIVTNDKIEGTYSNGIDTWDFRGTVEAIQSDTAGGNFATAWIIPEQPVGGRTRLLMTLDENHEQADTRFNVTH